MKQKGTAVEVAIAVLACECVASPEITGFGGGFVALIYRSSTGEVESMIATEKSHIVEFPGTEAIHTVGVPGMLKGLWEMYNRYETSISWNNLIRGAFDLASEHDKNNDEHANKFESEKRHLILSNPLLQTVTAIMNNEPKEFYDGELGDKFISDMKQLGSEMVKSDLQEYE